MLQNQKCNSRGCRIILISIASFYFLHYATLGTMIPFAGYFFKERGFTGTEIGILLGILPMNRFLFTSLWTDIYTSSKSKTLFISLTLAVSTASLTMLLFFNSFIMTAVLLFSFSLLRVGVVPVIDNTAMNFGDKYGVSYGRLRLFGSIGFIFAVLFTGYLLDNSDMDSLLYVLFLCGMSSLIPLYFIDLKSWSPKTKQKTGDIFTKDFKLVVASLIVYMASFSFHGNFFNVKIDEAGLSQTQAGYMWSIGVTLEVIFMFSSALLFRHFSARNLTALSMGIAALRALMIALSNDFYILLAASSLHGFAFGTFHIGLLTYIRKIMTKDKQLKAQSLYSGLGFGMGFILGSIASGIIYDHMGVDSVFYVSSLLSLGAGAVILMATNDSKN